MEEKYLGRAAARPHRLQIKASFENIAGGLAAGRHPKFRLVLRAGRITIRAGNQSHK
jgi:hypothetical protein